MKFLGWTTYSHRPWETNIFVYFVKRVRVEGKTIFCFCDTRTEKILLIFLATRSVLNISRSGGRKKKKLAKHFFRKFFYQNNRIELSVTECAIITKRFRKKKREKKKLYKAE